MSLAIDPAGFIPLGPANPTAIKRLAIHVQNHIDAGLPIPRSPFAQYVAHRITDPDDKQDFLASVSGPRGSGKSYSCLYILTRISEEIALILGGSPLDYFNPDTNVIALEDAQNVSELLANKAKYQCILIDDGSVGLNSHDWNSKASKNFIRICTTMRTRRWCIIVNAPQQKNLDNSLRDFIQVSLNVVGSFHKGGFNLLKATRNQISVSGKTYRHKLNYDGHKIDLWAAFAPNKEIVKRYDRVRDESAIRLNERIAKTGDSRTVKKQDAKSRAEINAEREVVQYADAVREAIKTDPNISVRGLSAKICLSNQNVDRLLNKMGIALQGRPAGRPRKVS